MRRLIAALGTCFALAACTSGSAPSVRRAAPSSAAAGLVDATISRNPAADAGSDRVDAASSAFRDTRFLGMEKDALAALRRSGRRIALLEPRPGEPTRTRIPTNWKAFDAVLLRLQETPTSYNGDLVEEIAIYWHARGIDGSITLALTDEQIYLRSGHDNPHPNHLYWLAPATSVQREAVTVVLKHLRTRRPIDCKVEGVSAYQLRLDEARKAHCFFSAPCQEQFDFGKDHLGCTATNAAAVLDTLNRSLPKDVPRLPVPTVDDLEQRVVLSNMADELKNWLRAE